MRTRLLLPFVLVAVLAGCGNSGSSANSSGSTAAGNGSGTTASSGSKGKAASGKVDCSGLKAAGGRMVVSLQVLAQLDTPENIASVKNKEIGNLDLDQFAADMTTLHQLDGHGTPLGDPKAAIDFYTKVGEAAKVLFATDPPDQAAIDTYMKTVGPIGDFLSHQTPIAAAIEEAHC